MKPLGKEPTLANTFNDSGRGYYTKKENNMHSGNPTHHSKADAMDVIKAIRKPRKKFQG